MYFCFSVVEYEQRNCLRLEMQFTKNLSKISRLDCNMCCLADADAARARAIRCMLNPTLDGDGTCDLGLRRDTTGGEDSALVGELI